MFRGHFIVKLLFIVFCLFRFETTGLQICGLVIHSPRNISNTDVMDETTVKRNRSTAKRALTRIHQTLEEQIEREREREVEVIEERFSELRSLGKGSIRI